MKHDDVIKWKHFPRYWPFVPGIHRSPVNSPHKGKWCVVWLTNGWIKKSRRWWFETPSCPLWHQYNDYSQYSLDKLWPGTYLSKIVQIMAFSWLAPSHYLAQCWQIVNWTHRKKRQRITNQNTTTCIHENALENVVCKICLFYSSLCVLRGACRTLHCNWMASRNVRSRLRYNLAVELSYETSHKISSRFCTTTFVIGAFWSSWKVTSIYTTDIRQM